MESKIEKWNNKLIKGNKGIDMKNENFDKLLQTGIDTIVQAFELKSSVFQGRINEQMQIMEELHVKIEGLNEEILLLKQENEFYKKENENLRRKNIRIKSETEIIKKGYDTGTKIKQKTNYLNEKTEESYDNNTMKRNIEYKPFFGKNLISEKRKEHNVNLGKSKSNLQKIYQKQKFGQNNIRSKKNIEILSFSPKNNAIDDKVEIVKESEKIRNTENSRNNSFINKNFLNGKYGNNSNFTPTVERKNIQEYNYSNPMSPKNNSIITRTLEDNLLLMNFDENSDKLSSLENDVSLINQDELNYFLDNCHTYLTPQKNELIIDLIQNYKDSLISKESLISSLRGLLNDNSVLLNMINTLFIEDESP